MRLPWIQVAEEAWGISRELSGLLPRVKPQQARGLLLDLWAWGLSLGPEDQLPDGVVRHPRAVARMAGAVEWTRDPEELAAALEAVGVIERLPDGIRVRGMGRYASTWKKNRGGESNGLTNREGTFIYVLRRGDAGPVKIGVSKSPEARLAKLQTACAEPLALLRVLPGGQEREAALHARFAHLRLEGEWFRPDEDLLKFFASEAPPCG